MDRIDVAFRGEGSGRTDLTWGQHAMLQAMRRERSWLPMGGRQPARPGTTLDDVTDELRYTFGRYQSFRTRLRFAGDAPPTQEVAAEGVTFFEVVEAGDEPERVAAEVEHRFRTTEPDLEAEWPLRMAVVCRAGVPSQIVAIMPHLVTDGIGAAVMLDEVTRRVATPAAGLQPLDLVEWQRSDSGRRQHTGAMRHWERHLPSLDPFPGSRSQEQTPRRYRKCLFTSPLLTAAVPAVAARTGVDAATVLLTAFMTVLGRLTGDGTVAVRQVVSNRFRSGLSDVVSPITQLGLCVADVSGGFDDALAKVGRAGLSAGKYAYYNPLPLPEARTACFNDRRAAAMAVLPQTVAGPSTFAWTDPPVGPTEPLFVHVDDAPGALLLTVDVDTAALSPADAEACARGIEEVIAAAAR